MADASKFFQVNMNISDIHTGMLPRTNDLILVCAMDFPLWLYFPGWLSKMKKSTFFFKGYTFMGI